MPRLPRAQDQPSGWLSVAVMIGLSLYTYSTARFAPFIIIALALYLALLHRDLFPSAFPGLVLAFALAGLVFLPQGLFFVRQPESFVERAREVTFVNPDLHQGNLGQAIFDSAFRTLGMFAFKGDAGVDKNIPGRPLFDPLSALLMILGVVVAVRRFRQPAYGFLIIWLAVMFAPSFLAVSGTPNYLRITGLIPALFILPALGAVWLWEDWESRLSIRQTSASRFLCALPLLLVTLAFVGGMFHSYHSYFQLWARLPELARSFNADSFAALETARRIVRKHQRPVLLAGRSFDNRLVRPGFRFLLFNQPEAQFILTFDPTSTFIFPDHRAGATYLFTHDSPDASILDRYFDQASPQVVGTLPSGRPITLIQLLDPRPQFEPARPVPARFGDQIFVYGFDMPKDIAAGEAMKIRWYWRILTADQRDLALANQLFGRDGDRRGQLHDRAFAPNYWPAGTSGISTFEIDIDPETPTGAYWLRAAAYYRDQQNAPSLPVLDAQGNHAGNHLNLGPIKIHGRPPALSSEGLLPSPPVPDNPLTATFADQISLLGYTLADHTLVPGQSLDLTLFWSPRGRPTQDYTVFVHLLDSQGQLRGQADSPPTSGRYPTSVWDAGEFIADLHTLPLAPDLPAGDYTLLIGLYYPGTGQRLSTVDEDGQMSRGHLSISGFVVEGQ